ncbi:M24 family metallopeptidase [Escherichia coli]|uniref:M24 family metallopeptidase n=1 Tax=Escherichia coli TaxID=562 RepID=UPI003D8185C8
MRCQQVDDAARRVITEAGYGKFFGHNTGHAIGIEVHEEPRFSPRDTTTLQPGMILTVEPGIYLPGQGGARHRQPAGSARRGELQRLPRAVPAGQSDRR